MVAGAQIERVTPEQLKTTLRETHVYKWTLRDCSICHGKMFYMIDREKVYFSTCDCDRLGARSLIKSSHEYLVRVLNAHTPEHRRVLWDELINSAKWIPSGIHKARPVIDPPALSRYQQNEISAEQAVRSSST